MLLKQIRRWRNRRGHGVHSPFAFRLITQVFNDKYPYYAFYDIPHLMNLKELSQSNPQLQHLSYRLIQHLKPANALEIGADNGHNTHYIASSLHDKPLHYVHPENRAAAESLLKNTYSNITFADQPSATNYEAVFINPAQTDITAEELSQICTPQFFWVVYDIQSPQGKKFWREANKMEQPVVSFEKPDMGVIVKDEKLKKQHYFI